MQTKGRLIIVALLAIGLTDYGIREIRTRADFTNLKGTNNNDQKRQIVQRLVTGCHHRNKYSLLPGYFSERIFGRCRSITQAQLSAADLSELDLRGATFTNTNLSGANLYKARLSGANFSEANLSNADLSFATARSANFHQVNLSNATLNNTLLIASNLSNANLSGATLTGVSLNQANLSSTTFSTAHIRETRFLGANLDTANFSNATVSGSHFGSANVSDTTLTETILLSSLLRPAPALRNVQVDGDRPPLICNTALPKQFNQQVDEYRDCDNLTAVLQQRHPDEFQSLEAAETYFDTLMCESFVSKNVKMTGDKPVNCPEE